MRDVSHFFIDFIREAFKGGKLYYLWMISLAGIIGIGILYYFKQWEHGLIVTGMSDQVSWGVYIANFTFLVGIAASAVMLVIPSYIFHERALKDVVLLAEGLAVAACIMCLLFVIADLGRPSRIFHLLPWWGELNLPYSMLAWDMVILSGYLFLNLTIPFYILFTKYKGYEPNPHVYFPGVVISIGCAITIHTVTAFLLSSNVARPFWHTAILGPRFLASAFAAGPAFFILTLQVIKVKTAFPVPLSTFNRLALIATIALQIHLFLLLAEVFTEFYRQTEHSTSAVYLFFGLDGKMALVPWIWTAIALNGLAVIILTIHPLRKKTWLLISACSLMVIGIWIEKGMGLIVPGFIPTPLGEVFEYQPTWIEIGVSFGIWATGLMIYTLLAKAAIAIEMGILRQHPRTTFEKRRIGAYSRIIWTKDLFIHHPIIDSQHQKLFKQLDTLYQALSNEKGEEVIRKTILFFEQYIVSHFHEEEMLMKQHHYPYYEEHKALHEAFIRELHTLENAYKTQEDKYGPTFDIYCFGVQWLENHIKKVDRELGAFLATHQQSDEDEIQ